MHRLDNPTVIKLIVPLALLLATPFALSVAGDAQVHLAVAEAFTNGRPFQYNPGGEVVVASTSPFWTLMLIVFYRLAGAGAPVLLKVTSVIVWLATGHLIWVTARDLWRFSPWQRTAAVSLWLLHTTVVANALTGLENVLAAFQVLLVYLLVARYRDATAFRRSAALGLLFGWTLLTRPDGALFAALPLALYALGPGPAIRASRATWRARLGRVVVLAGATVLVAAPWYAYQYHVTGQLVSHSSYARLYNGRLGSLAIVPNVLYFHPKATLSLAAGFAPLALGCLVFLGALLYPGERSVPTEGTLARSYAARVGLLVLAAGYGFYSLVVGAESFGRYFLPLYPFLFLGGIAGLALLSRWAAARGSGWARGVALLALAILVACSGLDYARRLGEGRFAVRAPLDVLYGPAQRRYLSLNVVELAQAPSRRRAFTDDLLRQLGAPADKRLTIAVTEVQLRYYVDERVDVLSLDGRTSASILAYIDPPTGVPYFDRYLADTKPEYLHASQWCAVGGWLASLRTQAIEENLVCAWERQAQGRQPGARWDWEGRTVELVAPDIVRIAWD